MVRKFNQVISAILGTKLMMWAVPDSKRFIKGIAITAVAVLLVIYFHGEYLRWAEFIWKHDLFKQFIYYQKSNYLNFINYFVHLFKKNKKESLSKSQRRRKDLHQKY